MSNGVPPRLNYIKWQPCITKGFLMTTADAD
jgi:hypothetical protein